MSMFLRVLALVAFIVAAVIALVVDTANALDVMAAISVGLALWVGSTLTT